MNNFPEFLSVSNKSNFEGINNQRILNLFREYVFLHILQNYRTERDENNYVDLDVFCNKNLNRNMKLMKEMVVIVSKELEALGWKTALSFNDTGLFIYSTNNKPSSCW